MFRNKDYIRDAIVNLESTINQKVNVEGALKEYDAIVAINGIDFTVSAKSEIRSSNIGLVLSQIMELKAKTKRPIIVIAKFIAAEVAKELKSKSINYLDISGNAYIKEGNLFLYVTGQKVVKAKKTNQSRAFQDVGLRLIFNFLVKPESLQLSYRELSEQTGIAIGSISNVMKELEDLNFLIKTETKRVFKKKQDLLDRWIVAYHDVLRPKLVRRTLRFADKNSYSVWKELVLKNQCDNKVFWGGEPAAALITNYLKPSFYTIYTTTGWQECAKNLSLVPDDNGDVEILTAFWNDSINKTSQFTVPALLVYADLIGSGLERNLETAKILFENELQNIK